MLSIYLGMDWGAVQKPDDYFDDIRDRSWFDEDIVKQIVKDIDNSDLVSQYLLVNPVFGDMSTKSISGGAKTLILLYKNADILIDLSACGENCTSWIAKISKMTDCKASISGFHINFTDDLDFDILVENDGKHISTVDEWNDALNNYVMNCERNTEFK